MVEQFGIINFPAFLLAGILLNITPGSDTMYILARTASQGRKAGILSALGISTGSVVHTIAAACGLSVILASSAAAFHVVKFLGAGYLIYLGIKALYNQSKPLALGNGKNGTSYRSIYVAGALTNILNPKVALFFIAFLPQFIVTGQDYSILSFLILGATFITTGTIWCLCLAIFASLFTEKLTGRSRFAQMLQRLTGMVFIGLGVKLALSNQ